MTLSPNTLTGNGLIWFFLTPAKQPPLRGHGHDNSEPKRTKGEIVPQNVALSLDQTLDPLAKHGVSWTVVPYGKMQLNGGGIHCSTTPQIRDPV